MTAVQSKSRVMDIATDTTIAASPDTTIVFEIVWELGKDGSYSHTEIAGSWVDGVWVRNLAYDALVTAGGGPDLSGPRKAYMLSLSLGGGDAYDAHKMVTHTERGIVITESGGTLWHGYEVNGLDRVTFHNVSLQDAVYGQPNTIIPQSFGGVLAEFGAGLPIRRVKGVLRTSPGNQGWAGRYRMAYTPIVAPELARVLLDTDVNADYLDKALAAFVSQLAGILIPRDTVPYGFRGNWVVDGSDAALNLAGISRSVSIGIVGTTPYLTFTGNADVTDLTQAQILESLPDAPLTPIVDLDSLVSILSLDGGTTNHGLPESAKVSSVLCINTGHAADSLNWDDSLPVFCAADGSGNGGVYYWPHDGLAYPIGQAIPGANSLLLHPKDNTLYVASLHGVYTHSADVTDPTPWQQVGGLAAQVKGMVGGTLYGQETQKLVLVAEVTGTGSGGDGLYVWPGFDGSGTLGGYDGWSAVYSGTLVCWTYNPFNDTLFFTDSQDPTAVLLMPAVSSGGTAGISPARIVTPTLANVTGLVLVPKRAAATKPYSGGLRVFDSFVQFLGPDPLYDALPIDTWGDTYLTPAQATLTQAAIAAAEAATTGSAEQIYQAGMQAWLDTLAALGITSQSSQLSSVAVLTTLGAFGIYLIRPDLGLHLIDLNADNSLVDTAGNAVMVNTIVGYGGMVRVDGVPTYVALAACTDSGPYFSANKNGGSWQAVGTQSGVADVNFTGLAIGNTQTLVTEQVNRMYGASDNGFYVSHTSGRYWDQEFADKQNIGGYLSALGRQLGEVPYLSNDITSIGTIPGGGSINTSGTNLSGTALTGVYALGGGLVWARVLDERNKWCYKQIHTKTESPYGVTEFGEVSEIGTNATTDAATAAGRLALVITRAMAILSQVQITLQIDSVFADSSHKLRTLRPSHMVQVQYDSTPTYGVQFDNKRFYVLRHRLYKDIDDTQVRTQTLVGLIFRAANLTTSEIAESVQYALSRLQRYGK